MNFVKFMDLLEKSSLYFCRADSFEDKFEGIYPKNTEDLLKKISEEDSFKEANRPIIPYNVQRNLRELIRKLVFINCWHINDRDSNTMWHAYSKYECGIAIQSTYKRLMTSFVRDSDKILPSKVTYVDYYSESFRVGHVLAPFVHKRKEFELEKEFRVMYSLFPASSGNITIPNESGRHIEIDLDKLIEKIIISPRSPAWFVTLVKQILQRYGINKEVVKSKIVDGPDY